MITLRLGELRMRIDTAPVRPALESLLASVLLAPGDDSPPGVLLQLGVSKLAGLILWYMRSKGLETPTVPRKADPTPYLLQHIAGVALAELEAREWECSYVEDENDIQITGLAAVPVAGAGHSLDVLAAPVVAAGGAVASGDAASDAAGGASPDEYGHGEPAGGDTGESRGSLVTAGHLGQWQDDGGADAGG